MNEGEWYQISRTVSNNVSDDFKGPDLMLSTNLSINLKMAMSKSGSTDLL
jgi:hypothetical protein